MKTIAAAVLALCAPLAATAADFSGTWEVKGDFGPKLRYTLLCVLKSNGNALNGPCASTQAESNAASGRSDGREMRFKYHTDFNGSGVHLVYTGNIQPDGTVKGKVSSDGSDGIFQAKPVTDTSNGRPVTWKIDAAFSETLKYVALCTFASQGARVSGPCTVINTPSMAASGTLDGAKVVFHYDTDFQGRPTRVDYAGTVQPDGTLAGTIKAGGSSGSYTARQR